MSQENVERVKQVFGWTYAVETWPTPVLQALYHPELIYHPRPEDPETDTQFGRDAYERLVSGYIEALTEIRFDVLEVIEAGDCVIASTVLHGRGDVSGVEVTDTYVHVYKFRDGVVVEIWEYRTLPEALQLVGPTIRLARVEDAAQMARVNVRSWQETYRGLMSDAVLDDPGLLTAREQFWTAALTDERYRENRVAVAERDGELVGIAMSGPPMDAAPAWARQLYVLYVLAADHGTGAGPGLLEAVLDPEESASLWVADPNPRAQAFYRKHGFAADGTDQVDGRVREIRMVRGGKT